MQKKDYTKLNFAGKIEQFEVAVHNLGKLSKDNRITPDFEEDLGALQVTLFQLQKACDDKYRLIPFSILHSLTVEISKFFTTATRGVHPRQQALEVIVEDMLLLINKIGILSLNNSIDTSNLEKIHKASTDIFYELKKDVSKKVIDVNEEIDKAREHIDNKIKDFDSLVSEATSTAIAANYHKEAESERKTGRKALIGALGLGSAYIVYYVCNLDTKTIIEPMIYAINKVSLSLIVLGIISVLFKLSFTSYKNATEYKRQFLEMTALPLFLEDLSTDDNEYRKKVKYDFIKKSFGNTWLSKNSPHKDSSSEKTLDTQELLQILKTITEINKNMNP